MLHSQEKEETMIEEGFVSFATPNYFPLLEVLIESVHSFSTRPIIVYGVWEDVPFSTEKYPRLIKRKIPYIEGDIMAQKSLIMLESGLKYGIYVEADDIVNLGVDRLFDYCRQSRSYPLCPIHPSDPTNHKPIMDFFGVKEKTMPYVHGHVLFSHACMPFIQEWRNLCVQYDHHCAHHDETLLNILLWKYGVTEYMAIYDPYYGCYHNYVNAKRAGDNTVDDTIYYSMFHGCKTVSESWYVLRNLQEVHGIKTE